MVVLRLENSFPYERTARGRRLRQRADRMLYRVAVAIARDAKALAPVDTTRLRESIRVRKNAIANGGGWVIQSDVGEPPYDEYQEFGFIHWITGQFIRNAYMGPAALANVSLVRRVNREIAEMLLSA